MMNKETYLGDGLYVSLDKLDQICLRAPRSEGDHYVYLDRGVFYDLIYYVMQLDTGTYKTIIKMVMDKC